MWLVTCIIGRALNLGLLGQRVLTKIAIIYAVAIRLVVCTMYVILRFVCLFMKGVRLEINFLNNVVCIPAFVPGRREPFAGVVVYTCTKVARRCCALLFARILLIFYHVLFFHVRIHPKLYTFFTTPPPADVICVMRSRDFEPISG